MLTFRLLGEVVILRDGNRLDQFRSQKEAALLIYLAHTGQSHPRDAIAELLWEDRTVKQMRSNLRTILARLRGQVGDALLTSRTALALAHESVQQVDSSRLLQALSGNLAGQAEMYDSLGKNYLQLGESELAMKSLEQGVQLAELVGDRRIQANLLLGLAKAKQEQGDATAAESLLLQALAITRQANLQSIEWEATIGLAELLRSTRAKEAGAYAAQAVELARRLSNPHFLACAAAIATEYTNR